jgi:hypothetical protein
MKKYLLRFSAALLFAMFFLPFSSSAQTTQLRPNSCGTTLAAVGSNMTASAVSGAIMYRYRMNNLNTGVLTIFDSPSNKFNFVNAGANPLVNQTFQVDVAVNLGSGFGPFGALCNVNTPVLIVGATTSMVGTSCGITLASLGTNMFAFSVNGAISYRFRMVNLSTNVVTVYDTPNRWFNFVFAAANAQNNQTFEVQVAVNLGAGFGPFSPMCLINTPIVPTTTTKIRNDFCGAYISSLGANIFADNVSGTVAYRFRIRNVITNVTVIYDRPNRWFNLILAGLNPQNFQQFEVDVAINLGSGFGSFGQPCFVFTPHLPPTQVSANHCGTTKEMLFYEYFTGVTNTQATQYQFRIRNGSFTAESPVLTLPETRFSDFTSFAYGTSYLVDVRMNRNGVWGPYGPSCTISTVASPFTQLQTTQYGGGNYCNTTLASVSSTIYAFAIPLATAYRFRVTRDTYEGILQTTVRSFKLTDVPNFNSNLVFGATYNVEVSVQVNGVFGPFGAMCQLTTPTPTTQLRADFCGANLTSNGQNIFAVSVSGATQYRFEINNGVTTTLFTTNNRWFNLLSAGVAAPNTLYTVRVAFGVNGTFYPFGSACTVLSPPALMAPIVEGTEELAVGTQEIHVNNSDDEENSNFELINSAISPLIYPNPYVSEFQISLPGYSVDSEVQLNVFDATGALIYSFTGDLNQLQESKFGFEFTPGVYVARVVLSDSTETIRFIKSH